MPAPTVTTQTDSRATSARRADRRREVYEARRRVWALTELKRVRLCGWAPRSDEGVTIRVSECEGFRRAGVGNVQTCGSFWSCPVCSEKIAATRQQEIERVLRWWVDEKKGRVALVTLTVRHKLGHRLTTVWDLVAASWKACVSGRDWKADQELYGVPMSRRVATGKRAGQIITSNRIRTIRVVEVTHGVNGWHVHVHALLLLSERATDADVQCIGAAMFGRWKRVCKASGMGVPSIRRGVDARLITGDHGAVMSEYFVKAAFSASHEVAGGMRKEARKGNRTPFGILADVFALGLADDVELWGEWERGSKGRRAIAYTPGLLAEAAVEEVSDEDIVQEDHDGEVVATIDNLTWRCIRQHDGICDLLEAFEDSHEAGSRMLASWWRHTDLLRQ